MLFEVMISVVLLGLLLTLLVPLVKSVNESRRIADQRRVALIELSNLLEQVASWPREKVTVDDIQKLSLSETTKAALPDATLTSKATAETAPAGLMKIELALKWSQPGANAPPVRLTGWLAAAP